MLGTRRNRTSTTMSPCTLLTLLLDLTAIFRQTELPGVYPPQVRLRAQACELCWRWAAPTLVSNYWREARSACGSREAAFIFIYLNPFAGGVLGTRRNGRVPYTPPRGEPSALVLSTVVGVQRRHLGLCGFTGSIFSFLLDFESSFTSRSR